jgi:hypothetical protein
MIDLLPILLEMILWSARYDAQTAASMDFIERLKKDRAGVMNEFLAKIYDIS